MNTSRIDHEQAADETMNTSSATTPGSDDGRQGGYTLSLPSLSSICFRRSTRTARRSCACFGLLRGTRDLRRVDLIIVFRSARCGTSPWISAFQRQPVRRSMEFGPTGWHSYGLRLQSHLSPSISGPQRGIVLFSSGLETSSALSSQLARSQKAQTEHGYGACDVLFPGSRRWLWRRSSSWTTILTEEDQRP